MPTLETLDQSGFLFTETSGDWALLTADFGEGYELGALIGHVDGLRSWNIKIDALPDSTDQGAPAIGDLTRAQYLWQFFQRSKAAGNQPFWIEFDDPADGLRKQYLASFTALQLSYQVLCAKIYSTGLQLKQRRVVGVDSPIIPTPPVPPPTGITPTALTNGSLDTGGDIFTKSTSGWDGGFRSVETLGSVGDFVELTIVDPTSEFEIGLGQASSPTYAQTEMGLAIWFKGQSNPGNAIGLQNASGISSLTYALNDVFRFELSGGTGATVYKNGVAILGGGANNIAGWDGVTPLSVQLNVNNAGGTIHIDSLILGTP